MSDIQNKPASREQIIAAIKKLGEELGRAPTKAELAKMGGISWHHVYTLFGGIRAASRAAGLEPTGRGWRTEEGELLLDWAAVVRRLGHLPCQREYTALGRHHSGTLKARLDWSQVPHKFVLMVEEFELQQQWRDVLEIVVKRFPLLGRSTQGLPQRTRRNTEEFSNQGSVLDERPAWMKAMKLRLVPWAMAIEILMSWSVEAQPTMAQGMSPESGNTAAMTMAAGGQDAVEARKRELERMIYRRSAAGADLESAQPGAPQPQHANTGRAGDPSAVPHGHGRASGVAPHEKSRIASTRIYGEPLNLPAMANAPTNESGVMILFGAMAVQLGFRIERTQTAFPDCEAKRQVAPGRWEKVWIEFEFESRNFKDHRHDPGGCDLIVCWKHNWPECSLEVVELRKAIGKSGDPVI